MADPTRVGEWSHEATGARWLNGATHATPGARFVGMNRMGGTAWSKNCVVDIVEPGRTYSFHTPSTSWRYDLAPVENGTLIRQSFTLVNARRLMSLLLWLVVPAHRDRSDALGSDLVRLGDVASREGQRSEKMSKEPILSDSPGPAV